MTPGLCIFFIYGACYILSFVKFTWLDLLLFLLFPIFCQIRHLVNVWPWFFWIQMNFKSVSLSSIGVSHLCNSYNTVAKGELWIVFFHYKMSLRYVWLRYLTVFFDRKDFCLYLRSLGIRVEVSKIELSFLTRNFQIILILR